MSQENVELVWQSSLAWSDGGEDALLQYLDADVEWLPPRDSMNVGIYRGHDGVVRATKRWIEAYEWLLIELEQIVGAGDRVVSIHRWRAKARYTGIEFDTPLAYVWTFRDGKIIHYRAFSDPKQALEAAGLRE